MTFQLSDRAKALIPKARIVSFATLAGSWDTTLIARLQAADDEGRYLTDEDLAALNAFVASSRTATVLQLREQAQEIVTAARQQVLQKYPGIAEPGGDLYPAIRAEACWRDFWHFLRCITYGIASGSEIFTSEEGLHYMNLLYREMGVPLDAMVTGLEYLKHESLQRLPEKAELMSAQFDHLIGKMKAFRV